MMLHTYPKMTMMYEFIKKSFEYRNILIFKWFDKKNSKRMKNQLGIELLCVMMIYCNCVFGVFNLYDNDNKCNFPFRYEGIWSKHCLLYGFTGVTWCSLTKHFQGKWKICTGCCVPETNVCYCEETKDDENLR